MAHSVVKVIENDLAESLTLIVGEDGIITPDKETALSILGNRPTTDLNILYMNKTAGNKLDVTLDSLMYINSDEVEDADFNMDEVSRNIRNLQLDHDYTTLKSPTRPPIEEEVDLEDELAQTLRLLDGNLPDDEVEQKISQINKQKEKDASKKIESPVTTIKAIKGAKMISTNQKLVKIAQKALEVVEKAPQPKVTTEGEEMEEDEDDESSDEEDSSDDGDDSDFTLDDEKPSKQIIRPRVSGRRSISTEKPTKSPVRLSKIKPTINIKTPKIPGGKQPPKTPQASPVVTPIEKPATAVAKSSVVEQQDAISAAVAAAVNAEPEIESKPPQLESISRIVDKKALPPKKEKKVPKPLPDDFALFSTPDIIRRVGSGKDNTPTSETPTKQPLTPTTQQAQSTSPKPAKISPESRSRTTSIESKASSNQNPSKLPAQKRHSSDSKQSRDSSAIGGATMSNRRLSMDKTSNIQVQGSNKAGAVSEEAVANVPVQEMELTNSSNESIGADVGGGLEVVPSAEDIRAIIQSDATKTFTTYEAATNTGPSTQSIAPATTTASQAAVIDPVTVSSLDHIDQTLLLDNISPDLITDDILYQVAQSLVDNTVLQNAIDKMEVDPAVVSGFIGESQDVNAGDVESGTMNMTNTTTTAAVVLTHTPQQSIAPAQQIVRPDGRVITLPPVERPTTRSRNKRGPIASAAAGAGVVSSPATPTPSLDTSMVDSPATSVLGTPTSGVRVIKTPIKPLDDDHVSGNELDSSDDDDGDDEDPNKLWCVCNQPHNNRFMICCDTCEEWYHGKCVNITKAMGQAMEAEGKEWMCIYCKDLSLRRPKAAARRIRKASRTSSESASKSSTSTVSTPNINRTSTNQQQQGKQVTKQQLAQKQKQRAEGKPTGGGCLICGKPTANNKLFCSDECIVKHASNVEKKVVVYDRRTHKLLSGPNAPTASNLDRWLKEHPTYEVVRTKKANNPQEQQKKAAALTGGPLTQSKLKLVRNDDSPSAGVSLAVQKKGVNIGVMKHGPSPGAQQMIGQQKVPKLMKNRPPGGLKLNQRKLTPTILNSSQSQGGQPSTTPKTVKLIPAANLPQYLTPQQNKLSTIAKAKAMLQTKLNMSASSAGSTTPTSAEKKVKGLSVNAFIRDKAPGSGGKERKQPMPVKTPTSRQAEGGGMAKTAAQKEEIIREGIRKSLLEQLQNRLKLAEDLKLTDQEVIDISEEIESQLYKCFGDSGQKYRNKYRSLIFNIKDLKNQTLWRKICEKAINPYQLVRLSSDDLASQELALWRERETKHQLDMIKKSELELMNCNRQYVFKTHKGEQVFEDEKPKENLTDVISDLGADSTLDRDKDSDKSSKDRDKKSSSSKSNRRDRDRSKDRSRDRDRKSSKDKTDSKERRRDSKDRSRKKRSRSRDRSDRGRKRSRSRDRRRDKERRSSHKSSRHKKDLDKLDKKSTELLEQLVDKHILKPFEDKLWKHVPQDDLLPNASLESDSDHEPTSTVTIPTPPRSTDAEEPPPAEKAPTATSIGGPLTNDSDDKFDIPATPSPTTSPKAPKTTIPTPVPPSSASSNASSSPGTSAVSEPLWRGTINMVDVAEISITAHEVSGNCDGLSVELPPALDIVGRISPDTVWDYIGNMKSSNSKVISLLRLNATNVEEKMPYIALYSYLSSRNRLGVVKVMNKVVKDFYILPLASHRPIPQALLPLNGPGFEESRPHLLLGIVIRHKRKRPAIDSAATSTPTIKRVKVDVIITGSPKDKYIATPMDTSASTLIGSAASKETAATSRSYTPPPTTTPRERDPRKARLPTPPTNVLLESSESTEESTSVKEEDEMIAEGEEEGKQVEVEALDNLEEKEKKEVVMGEAEEAGDEDEPYSPEDSDPDSIIVPADSSRLNANEISSLLTGSVKASSFIESGLSSSQTFEPFTSKFDSIPGLDDSSVIPASTIELQRKMAELDQRIAMQKAEIDNMSHDIASTATTDIGTSVLANIALPSDLQQILENIKTIGGTAQKDAAAKTPERYASPVVHNPRWSPPDSLKSTNVSTAPANELTMPLILPRMNIRNTSNSPQSTPPLNSIPLNLPSTIKSTKTPLTPSYDSTSSVLSSLTEEDLIRKAAEMLGEAKANAGAIVAPPRAKKIKMDLSGVNLNVPPPPLPVPAPMTYSTKPPLPPLPLSSGYQTIPVIPPLPPRISTPAPPKKTPVEMAQPPIPGLEDEIL